MAAAALGLVAGEAYAQSSVTLYGVADAGVEFVNHQKPGDSTVVRVQSGNLSGSRWGLRGSEDLGGGLRAIFALESGRNTSGLLCSAESVLHHLLLLTALPLIALMVRGPEPCVQ